MRRRFARGRRGPLRRMMATAVPPLLIRSNELLAAGQFAPAADGLEELAQAARARGGRHAARLFLEAGRARLLAGEKQRGLELIGQGARLVAVAGLPRRAARSGQRIAAELRDRGMQAEAQSVEDILRGEIPASVMSEAEPAGPNRVRLPTHCPACGASVHPDDVEWLDDATAECAYCGSPLRAE